MAKHQRRRQKGGRAEPEPRFEPSAESGGLTFNPFAGLAQLAAKLPPASACSNHANEAPHESLTAPAAPNQEASEPAPQGVPYRAPLTLRTESKGRHGKVVTRIVGIDLEHLKQLGVQLQKALGCGSVLDGQDLVLLGAVEARAAAWLRNAGATRVRAAGEALEQTGHQRQAIQPGQRVAIVLKADQRSGNLTEGIVDKLLTRSPTHPHGIKVRLVSGLVGRVKKILDP